MSYYNGERIEDDFQSQEKKASPLQSQLNADAATIKHLQEENERLTLENNLFRMANRDHVEENKRYKEALSKIRGATADDPFQRAYDIATQALTNNKGE